MTVVVQLAEACPAALLAALRMEKVVIARTENGDLWLRVEQPDSALATRLAALPHRGFFRVNARNLLTEKNRQVPSAVLPEGLEWNPLTRWLQPLLPAPRLPGSLSSGQVPFRLRRGHRGHRVANGLVTDLTRWAAYGESAGEGRLQPLRFGLASDGRVLVLGTPLPSLRATLLHAEGGLILPLGKEPELPRHHRDGLRGLLGLNQGELALFHDDGSFERLRQDDLVRATRGAIRLSVERFQRATLFEPQSEI